MLHADLEQCILSKYSIALVTVRVLGVGLAQGVVPHGEAKRKRQKEWDEEGGPVR